MRELILLYKSKSNYYKFRSYLEMSKNILFGPTLLICIFLLIFSVVYKSELINNILRIIVLGAICLWSFYLTKAIECSLFKVTNRKKWQNTIIENEYELIKDIIPKKTDINHIEDSLRWNKQEASTTSFNFSNVVALLLSYIAVSGIGTTETTIINFILNVLSLYVSVVYTKRLCLNLGRKKNDLAITLLLEAVQDYKVTNPKTKK